MDIHFKKIFFTKGKVRVSYEKKDQVDGNQVPTNKTFKSPPHDDFLQALANLRIHFVMQVGYTNPVTVKDIESPKSVIVEDCEIFGITAGGTDDDPGIQISGQRKTQLEKFVDITTPFLRYSEKKIYKFAPELKASIERLELETTKYLTGEKRGKGAQQNLDFEPGKKQKLAAV